MLVADLNEVGTTDPVQMMSISHSPRGVMKLHPVGETDLEKLGSEGGNIGFIDGSVLFRHQ